MSSFEYLVNGRKFILNYSDLHNHYEKCCVLSDEEFIVKLPEIIHLACIISWLKGRGQHAIADDGCIHELVHLLHLGQEFLKPAREAFVTECKLCP